MDSIGLVIMLLVSNSSETQSLRTSCSKSGESKWSELTSVVLEVTPLKSYAQDGSKSDLSIPSPETIMIMIASTKKLMLLEIK